MQTMFTIIYPVLALAVGGAIGLAFGQFQNAALRHNQRLEAAGKFKSGWSLMPGSGTRIAFLLIALALIQLVCPMLFADGIQWWVSGGVAAGYGFVLFKQLREKRALGA
jgi:uncharacterized BrkB/YihY/UPF0761 family membrane protein